MNIIIFKHYFKRALSNLVDMALVLGIPLGFIILQGTIADGLTIQALELGGYNIGASVNAINMILGFQFFGTWLVFHFLFQDLRSNMRFRLGASPWSITKFIAPAVTAGWIYSVVAGVIVTGISSLIFPMYWGNFFIFIIVFLLTSIIGSLICILLFFFAKDLSTATTLHYVICFGFMGLSMLWFNIPFEDGLFYTIAANSNPLTIGTRAILHTWSFSDVLGLGIEYNAGQAFLNIIVLVAIAFVLSAIAVIAGRRRAF